MNNQLNNPDPVPPSAYPSLQPFTNPPPVLPQAWECTALLMPFSPVQSNSSPNDKAGPFFELCAAYINYQEGVFLSAQLAGSSGRMWWYVINSENQTNLSTDGGNTWQPVDLGWTLPTTSWFGNQVASCAGVSPLNWMPVSPVSWWKMPVPNTNPPAATWMWFDAETNLPARLMFGQGPPSVSMGDPNQLALFQMFSFTYFPSFTPLPVPQQPPTAWTNPQNGIDGFSFGNPQNFGMFTFPQSFGMTAFMTPVNEAFNPLPTRVLYNWMPDNLYQAYTDRAQNTLMEYIYNQNNQGNPGDVQIALLTGPAPSGVTPPEYSDEGFLLNYIQGAPVGGQWGAAFPFPQEGPTWVSTPGEDGTIQATVVNNSVLCPDNTVTIITVLFPPSPTDPNYPDSTYLWTWYSPLAPDGSSSRPVTFMQSQSGVGVGTSLALADYFYFEIYEEEIDPANFALSLTFPPGFAPSGTRKVKPHRKRRATGAQRKKGGGS